MNGENYPVVSFDNVSVKGECGCAPRLVSVSFNAEEGESVVVIGPNGSGKSTLLRLLNRELRPDKGIITFHGEKLSNISRKRLARQVAVLAQDEYADPRLKVSEYVSLGRIPYMGTSEHSHKDICEESMRDAGILHLAFKEIGTLSGGEKQRAALARTFAQQPCLLLLDEPTNHLDPLAREQLLNIVRKKGITTVTVLHDLSLARILADRIILLDKGMLVSDGGVDEMFESGHFQKVFGLRCIKFRHPVHDFFIYFFEAADSNLIQE